MLLRRLRGVVLTMLVWGIGWFAIALIPILLDYWFFVRPEVGGGLVPMLSQVMWLGFIFAVAGMICGLVFALVYAVAERGREVAALSRRRAALFGGIGGAVMTPLVAMLGTPLGPDPESLIVGYLMSIVGALAGAFLSAGSLAAAQGASLPADHAALGARLSA